MSKKRWRSLRTARVSPDDVRIRQTAPRTPREFIPARIAPAAIRTDRGSGSRRSGTDPDAQHSARHVRHRPGPDVTVSCRHCGAKTVAGPVAGFARSKPTARQRNPDGLRLLPRPAARYGRSRKAFLPPGPQRSRSIRQRERTKYGMGAECGDEKGGGFWVRGWDCWGGR
jgi:hypothetical protein